MPVHPLSCSNNLCIAFTCAKLTYFSLVILFKIDACNAVSSLQPREQLACVHIGLITY